MSASGLKTENHSPSTSDSSRLLPRQFISKNPSCRPKPAILIAEIVALFASVNDLTRLPSRCFSPAANVHLGNRTVGVANTPWGLHYTIRISNHVRARPRLPLLPRWRQLVTLQGPPRHIGCRPIPACGTLPAPLPSFSLACLSSTRLSRPRQPPRVNHPIFRAVGCCSFCPRVPFDLRPLLVRSIDRSQPQRAIVAVTAWADQTMCADQLADDSLRGHADQQPRTALTTASCANPFVHEVLFRHTCPPWLPPPLWSTW
jgi:hypothetical protein